MIEVVVRVAHVPHELSATFPLSIGGRRDWIVGITEPPDQVQLFPGAESVQLPGCVVEDGGRPVGCDGWSLRR